MKRTIILPLLTGMCLLTVSCHKNEFLNPVPTTAIADVSAFDTPDRILNQVKGLYLSAKAGNFLGGRFLIYNDVRAENWINETNNGVTALGTWNFTASNNSQEVTGFWGAAYATINSCNLFMDGMTAKGNTVAGATLAPQYVGEAKFIRALSYYSLLQLYARPYWDGNGSKLGVPLRLTGNKGPGNYDLVRSTTDQVYTQIIKDLDDAEAALPSSYPNPQPANYSNNVARAHKNTAIALKTRVYLSMGKYDKVITEANKIVPTTAPWTAPSGVANGLAPDITLVFKSPNTTSESIFSLPFVTGADVPGTQNQLGYYFASSAAVSGANGEYSLNANGVIADANWLATDKRRNFIFTATSGKKYLTKYNAGNPFPDFVPVIRYSEVMLNLAEARARSLNTVDPQAVAMLSAVRNRSDAATTYTVASFATAADLEAAILQERNIEFLGEGRRSPDLLRLGMTIPAKGTVPAFPSSDSRYIWPISANELLYNKLCVDNN